MSIPRFIDKKGNKILFFYRITETEEAKGLVERYLELMKLLGIFEKTVFDAWTEKVPSQIEINLKRSLIVRNVVNKLLSLNFSQELFAILKEVHYLKLMGKEGLPEVGLEFSEKSEIYRTYTLNLEKTIEWYNKIRKNSSKVELELIQSEIENIDALIETGITELNWNSES